MLKFKVGDKVIVTTGKDRGKEGKIEKIYLKAGTVLIPGINLYKKHVKGVSGKKGGIYDVPRALAFSKIAIICPKCKKPARVGFGAIRNGKVRLCRKCGREIDTKEKK